MSTADMSATVAEIKAEVAALRAERDALRHQRDELLCAAEQHEYPSGLNAHEAHEQFGCECWSYGFARAEELFRRETDDADWLAAEVERLQQRVDAALKYADDLTAKCPEDDWGDGDFIDAVASDIGRVFRRLLTAAGSFRTPEESAAPHVPAVAAANQRWGSGGRGSRPGHHRGAAMSTVDRFEWILDEARRRGHLRHHPRQLLEYVHAVHTRDWPNATVLLRALYPADPRALAEELAALAGVALAGVERAGLTELLNVYERQEQSANT